MKQKIKNTWTTLRQYPLIFIVFAYMLLVSGTFLIQALAIHEIGKLQGKMVDNESVMAQALINQYHNEVLMQQEINSLKQQVASLEAKTK